MATQAELTTISLLFFIATIKEKSMATDQDYQTANNAYTNQLRNLFVTKEGAPAARGGAAIDIDLLAERAGSLGDISGKLGAMTTNLLDAADSPVRQTAELKLLAQANSDLQVAVALLAAVEMEITGPDAARVRSVDAIAEAALAVSDLAGILDQPLEAGFAPFLPGDAVRGERATGPAKARKELQDNVDFCLEGIVRQAARTSSLALDSLFKLDGDLIKKAVAPLSKDLSELVDKVAGGLNAKIQNLLKTAFRLLLQAYDWVLALIGKDVEQAARKKIEEWIDELRTSHEKKEKTPDLAQKLVSSLFDETSIKADVANWLKTTQAAVPALNQATDKVEALLNHFEIKAQRTQTFLKAVGAVPEVASTAAAALSVANPPLAGTLASFLPTIEVVRAAVTMGLMGYALFSGYDHVDSGKVTFFKRFNVNIPDRVEGVRATVEKAVKV
jgi:hypothetical protein